MDSIMDTIDVVEKMNPLSPMIPKLIELRDAYSKFFRMGFTDCARMPVLRGMINTLGPAGMIPSPSPRALLKNKQDEIEYGVRSINTFYDGVFYRSRLEAKWAAFFTEMGWPFQYEPVDFIGWQPDFKLLGSRDVYVEVKPITITRAPKAYMDKLVGSGCKDEMLLVGESILASFGTSEKAILGLLCENDAWGLGIFGQWKDGDAGFHHHNMSYVDRISGAYNGKFGGESQHEATQMAVSCWKKACNAVRHEFDHIKGTRNQERNN